ncbi:transcription factor HES-2 isoform X1 [Vulpes lagopus]|uniref:transcription factor HES-2 isoform X1 n=1 Tax=Vulpes lagopus TaxID=494514 RepID=UPI001BC9375A|nr:transcription factor HES-2 isoform X1 [Vulpes lagopus]
MGVPRRAGDPAELRKSLKPLLEKRRRARINASLRQLKGLILPLLGREVGAGALGGLGGTSGAQIEQAGWAEGPLRKELARGLCAAPEAEAAWGWHEEPLHPGLRSPTPRQGSGAHGSLLEICPVCPRLCPSPSWPAQSSHYSKLEKADILEMTVRFLRELPASYRAARTPAPSDGYGEGYRACLARLARVLPACRVLEPAVSARLLEHLRGRASGPAPDAGRAGDPCGPPMPSPPPPPAPAPPAPPPRAPGFWRPW